MSFMIEIRNGVGHVDCREAIDSDGLIEAIDSMLSHEDFIAGMPCLWDFRRAETAIDPDGIRQVGSFMSRQAERRGHGRTAVVVTSDLNFGLARMYDLSTESQRPNPFRAFKSIDEALAWLDASP